MPCAKMAGTLSIEDDIRLGSWRLAIAGEARPGARHDGAGVWRFGSRGALCIYADGQYHDFSDNGPTAHGSRPLRLIQHLYPDADPVELARAWLARHPGSGDFTVREDEAQDEFAGVEAMAYIAQLYKGAALIEDTPAFVYLTETRCLPLFAEDAALLRWIGNYRGAEGALLYPVTDDGGQLVALFGVYVTPDGRKSPHGSGRFILKGMRKWGEHGLFRLGAPGSKAFECEGAEKGLAARAAGAEYVVVTGGVSRIGKVPLPPQTTAVVIVRDADSFGSPPDQALWRGVVRRLGQGLKILVTARPNGIAAKDAPSLKDLDDLWRHDPEAVSFLLAGATLDHRRLGEVIDDAILDEMSHLAPVPLDRARKAAAEILRVKLGALDDELAKRVRARIEQAKGEAPADVANDDLPGRPISFEAFEPWDSPVDGAELLTEISDTLAQYARLSKSCRDAVALGIVHGHTFDFRDIMPIFAITSPQPRSGKTRLMTLVARTAPKPLFISAGSAAFITRSIELHHPTVLCDEFDAVTKGDPEKAETIRAMINSVFNREGSTQGKCIGTDAGPVPRLFSTWSPVWLAGIKAVPRTIEDRAVHIALRRKLPSDKVKRLRLRDGPEFTVFRRKAARFAADNEQQLRDIEPASPVELEEVGDRAADTWDSLFAIADVAGGDWPRRARAAALVLAGIRDEDDNATAISLDGDDELELLADIRAILFAIDAYAPDAQALRTDNQLAVVALNTARSLAEAGQPSAKAPAVTPAIKGDQLAAALGATSLFPDRRWSEWAYGKPIRSHYITKILREYGIVPKTTRLSGGQFMRGFARADLDDAFARYVSSSPGGAPWGPKLASDRHTIENVEDNAKKENVTHSSVMPSETVGNASNSAGFKDVMNTDLDAAVENITKAEREPVDPAPSVASVGAPPPLDPLTSGSGGGMPFVMTKAMKAALRRLGITDADIEQMTPGDAHKLITSADEPDTPLEAKPRKYEHTPVAGVPKGATRRRGIGDRV
jgi:hypothetical protein